MLHVSRQHYQTALRLLEHLSTYKLTSDEIYDLEQVKRGHAGSCDVEAAKRGLALISQVLRGER